LIRPTIYPERVKFHVAVFGERGRMLVKASVEYGAEVDGEARSVEAVITPARLPRQRRHLWGGTMVLADARGERKVVDFMSAFDGEWRDDLFAIRRRDELTFLVDGVTRLRAAGVQVSVDRSFGDIMSERSMRVGMDLTVRHSGMSLFASPLVGDAPVDPMSLDEAVRRGRQWVVSDGKVVRVEEGVDLKLIRDSSQRVHLVGWHERSKIHGAMRLIRDSRIKDGMAPVLKRALSNEDSSKVPPTVQATLRDYQIDGKNWLVRMISSGSGGILADAMGLGKESATYTPVLTPQGWRKIGELKVGDQVYGSDGLPHNVIGVYPQGKKQIYKVTFSDGSSTNCGAEHLWLVRTPSDRYAGKPGRVMSLQQIMDAGLKTEPKSRVGGPKNSKWFIPMMAPAQFPEREFQIEPYALGALIANGYLGNTPAHSGSQEQLDEILKVVGHDIRAGAVSGWTTLLSSNIPGKNTLTRALGSLGLKGKTAHFKSIPEEYLFGSVEQRVSLLQGLMDNDGTVSKDGIVAEYNTASHQLAKDIVSLVQSLGGVALLSTRIPKYTYNGQRLSGSKDHRIRISLPEGINPFRIKSKADRFLPRSKYPPARAFDSVEPMGEEEAVCIAVDAPDRLYVTEDYILTHNTLQAITAFMEMRQVDPKFRLIVFVPTSLTVNWQREFEKFAPSVSVLIWEGPNRRKKADLLSKCDVTIVPYSVYMRDYDLINRFPFHLAYYDEAQWMKNPDTATHKAAIRCLAPTRIAMTGTPVENKLKDLHSIMAIACPGLLPPAKEFDEKIARPYSNGDSRAVKIMAEQIRPFTLRRTQEQVLGEMPEKTIIDHICPMTEKQSEYYESLREQSVRDRDAAIAEGNKAALNALYLKLLTKLRRAATDPRLADPFGEFKPEDSGKMVALKAIMSGIEEDDTNKCIIFSQWTDCLNLIRGELEERGERFCYLTGETKDRQGEVDKFQDEKGGIRYFLMSLKAGGVGLNITAANFVVIMDPWWNPAIESQATARAHRFGQKRAVTVYRLIAQDTVEEKIAVRKDLKQALADGIVDDKAIPTMSVDEIGGLLD